MVYVLDFIDFPFVDIFILRPRGQAMADHLWQVLRLMESTHI